MPVRLRITLLFASLVVVILGLVCSGIYYFSYTARIHAITTRLTNRAVTTARLLRQRELFDEQLVRRLDSLTTIALKNKTIEAYDYQNRKIYSYTDVAGDTLQVHKELLNDARVKGSVFFRIGDKEAVAYHYTDSQARIVVISAAEDVEGRRGLHTLLNILIASFLAGNAVVLIAGYFFSASLLQPVKKITADVAEISAQNLARRIKTGQSHDEWYQLTDTLNRLLNRLQESFELQRRFISNASHELSTPLTSISSQLEVSLQRQRDPEQYREVMTSIYQDVQHMSKLTQTLLEFAKASGNAGGLEIELVRIDEILLSLPAEMARLNKQYVVTLQFDSLPENEEHLLVFGNELLLHTAFKNLVVNACKYSDNHRANVTLVYEANHLVVQVCDTGRGIDADQLQTIFQPFYRIADSGNSKGFGLGLSLTDRIVKLHKGTINVESKVGTGTCFIINLPPANLVS